MFNKQSDRSVPLGLPGVALLSVRWWGGDPLCGRAHFHPVAQLFSLYFRPFCQDCKCHVHRVSHFLDGSGSQTFWFLEPFTLLKITECPKSFVCVSYICQYSLYYRLKRRNAWKVYLLINSVTTVNPLHGSTYKILPWEMTVSPPKTQWGEWHRFTSL